MACDDSGGAKVPGDRTCVFHSATVSPHAKARFQWHPSSWNGRLSFTYLDLVCAELASHERYAITLPNLTGSHSTLPGAWSPWRWLPCSVIRSTSTHWTQITDCELYLGSKDNGTWPCSEVRRASPSFFTDFWPEPHLPGGCSNAATNTTDATRDIKSTFLLPYSERKNSKVP